MCICTIHLTFQSVFASLSPCVFILSLHHCLPSRAAFRHEQRSRCTLFVTIKEIKLYPYFEREMTLVYLIATNMFTLSPLSSSTL